MKGPTTMITPYEMMFRGGVMSHYRPVSRWQERREINQALKEIMPTDKTWQLALLAVAVVTTCCVLFVQWWLI